MRTFNGRSSLHELQRALYVYHMNLHKPRVRPKTKDRQAKELIEACRALVKEYDDAEAYRWYLLTTPITLDAARKQFVIIP